MNIRVHFLLLSVFGYSRMRLLHDEHNVKLIPYAS